MAFCTNCGSDMGGGAFCPKCGAKSGEAPATGTSNVQINNLKDNPNIVCTETMGCFEIYEHQKSLNVTPANAEIAYYLEKMNRHKRQVLCNLTGNSIKMQAGAMQWMAGKVSMNTEGISSAKDLFGKAFKGIATGESMVKPVYSGNGYVMLEPTYKHILLEDVSQWGSGMVIEDGMFLACDSSVKEEVVRRSNASSALLGGEGLFNLSLSGEGVAVLESSVSRDKLIEIVLNNDEVKIDGNMAIAWSKSLEFTVEKSTKSFLGSIASGEGLVNVYRGTGKILLAPIASGTTMSSDNSPDEAKKTSSGGLVGSVASSLLDL